MLRLQDITCNYCLLGVNLEQILQLMYICIFRMVQGNDLLSHNLLFIHLNYKSRKMKKIAKLDVFTLKTILLGPPKVVKLITDSTL